MIQLDHSNPECQANLLSLGKQEAWAVLKTLRLLQAMTWHPLQSSKRLRLLSLKTVPVACSAWISRLR